MEKRKLKRDTYLFLAIIQIESTIMKRSFIALLALGAFLSTGSTLCMESSPYQDILDYVQMNLEEHNTTEFAVVRTNTLIRVLNYSSLNGLQWKLNNEQFVPTTHSHNLAKKLQEFRDTAEPIIKAVGWNQTLDALDKTIAQLANGSTSGFSQNYTAN